MILNNLVLPEVCQKETKISELFFCGPLVNKHILVQEIRLNWYKMDTGFETEELKPKQSLMPSESFLIHGKGSVMLV